MPKDYFKLVMVVLAFALVAAFTSQSLVDLADFLLVLTAIFIANKKNEFKKFFAGFHLWGLWPVWLIIIIVGLVINMGFMNAQVWISFIEFKWIITLLSVIYLVSGIIEPKKLIKVFIQSILILNLISIVLYFYRRHQMLKQSLPDVILPEARASGIFDAIMAFSHNIAPVFSLLAIFIFVSWAYLNRNEKRLLMCATFTSAILTLLTFTRGVWIGSAVAVTICLFLWNFKRALLASCALALICTILVFTNQSINDRVFSKTLSETTSNEARIALWKANWRMVKDYPVLGVGFGQNKNHLRKYYDELGYPPKTLISHAHNQYLQVWAGTGTLGLICYLVFLFVIFKTAWLGYKNASAENKGLLLGLIAGLLSFAIGALTEANFNISKNRFLFLLLAGLAIGFSNKKTLNPPV